MFAILRLVAGNTLIGVNVGHVVRLAPSGLANTSLELTDGTTLVVIGTLDVTARNLNLNLVNTGAPSSQGAAALG